MHQFVVDHLERTLHLEPGIVDQYVDRGRVGEGAGHRIGVAHVEST